MPDPAGLDAKTAPPQTVTVAKIHAACSHSHHNVLVIVIQLGNLVLSEYKRLEFCEVLNKIYSTVNS